MLLEWRTSLSVHNQTIDEEHQKLIAMMNDLFKAIDTNLSVAMIEEAFDAVMSYTRYHFKHEEGLFLQTLYPDKEAHIKAHHALLHKLEELRAPLVASPSHDKNVELMVHLKEWLLFHIQTMDMRYAPYLQDEAA